MVKLMQSYSPPYFIDADRRAKVEALLPEIDRLYKEYAEEHHFLGYSCGIILDGELIHSAEGGFTDDTKKIPVTSHTLFRIASMTKSFTAMAIIYLRDENKLRLDDPVHLYIPSMKEQRFPKDGAVITIRDLLIHGAGLPKEDPWADRKLDDTRKDLTELLEKGLFFSRPSGASYEYSNLGYTILGEIIGQVAGIPYQQFILEKIGKPLGMNEVAWDFREVKGSELAKGYRLIENNLVEEPLLADGVYGAMGGLITSLDSFSKYAAFHCAAWPSRNEAEEGPLKRSSLREMHQPWRFEELSIDKTEGGMGKVVVNAYGYGLRWRCDNNQRVIVGHSGGLPGFGCNWFFMPEYGLGIISFANITYAPTTKINLQLLHMLVDKAKLLSRQLPASNILQERQKALIAFLPEWKKAIESPIFADNFFLDRPIEALQKETRALFTKAGNILSIGEVTAKTELKGHFLVQGEKIDIEVHFSLTPQKTPLIQEYQAKEVEKTIHSGDNTIYQK